MRIKSLLAGLALALAPAAAMAQTGEVWNITTGSASSQIEFSFDYGDEILWEEVGGNMAWVINGLKPNYRRAHFGRWYATGYKSEIMPSTQCPTPGEDVLGHPTGITLWGDLHISFANDRYFIAHLNGCGGQWSLKVVGTR